MNRRLFLAASSAAVMLPAIAEAQSAGVSRTKWVVRPSVAYDALGFLSPLSGDPFYKRYYEAEVAEFGARLPAETMAAIAALKKEVAETDGLMSPAFYLYFSAGPDNSLDDLFASMDSADTRLKPVVMASPYWDKTKPAEEEAGWQRFKARLPGLRAILLAMRDAGFLEFREKLFDKAAATRLPAVRQRLASADVVSEAERYTGRSFDPTIEVVMMYFNQPHGVKVIGQKFLTGIAYDDNITIGTAAHELLHPPVDMSGPAATAALSVFAKDTLFQRILAERDKSYGYGTLDGLMNEDLVEAVDQVIADRLGIATGMRESAKRWQGHDGGMHVMAAGFYVLLKRSGFAATGGNLEAWLLRMAQNGSLAPAIFHAAAAEILQRPADALWPPPKPS